MCDRLVGVYVAKYVNKKQDMFLAAKGIGTNVWKNSTKSKLYLIPKQRYKTTLNHTTGTKNPQITNPPTDR